MEDQGRLAKTWETSAFDREKGEWTTTLNHSYEHNKVASEEDLKALIVNEAAPVAIKALRASSRRKNTERRALVAGDLQAPFGDPQATALFHQITRDTQPDEIVLVGDMVDFPALSTFKQRKEWVGSTQRGIDEYYKFLAETRANSPNSRITVVHGNHEQRLINSLERNLSEVAGIRQALGSRALLSVQNLARYNELGVDYVDGYPNGTFWLEDNLKFIHGTNVKKGGSNAAKYLQEETETTIYGHTHRMELAFRTRATRLGKFTIAAASPGALCFVSGAVPGFSYSPDAEGNIVEKAEDWQQGALLVNHNKNTHDIQPIRFTEEGALVDGRRITVPH